MGFFRNDLPFRRRRQAYFFDRLKTRDGQAVPGFSLGKCIYRMITGAETVRRPFCTVTASPVRAFS